MSRPPGLYEELLTRGFAREVAELESQGFTALQSIPTAAEARILLARHLLRLLTRALSVSTGDEATDHQLELRDGYTQPSGHSTAKPLSRKTPSRSRRGS